MGKIFCLLIGFLSVLFLQPASAPAIEKLSEAEMRSVTAQAGITWRTKDATFFASRESRTYRDIETRDRFGELLTPSGYAKYDLNAILLLNSTVNLDTGIFHESESLTFTDHIGEITEERTFDHPLNNLAMVFISRKSAEDNPEALLNLDNISVYHHVREAEMLLGDVRVVDFTSFESRLRIYPPEGDNASGIRAVGGTRFQIDSVIYENPDQFENIVVTGFMAGSSFGGGDLTEGPSDTNQIDTSTWSFEDGLFELGMPYYYHDNPEQQDTELDSHPFTLDFATNEERAGDYQSYMAINAPVRGSVRIKNISSDDFDMGPIAIDGVRLYRNYIEFPGRGIGN